jgi:hypothetical protein
MIGDDFNSNNTFFRDLTVCVLDKMEGEVRWVNKFTSGNIDVIVPFFYAMSGDERFLLDAFSDDVVSDSRYTELNTDSIPRGHVTMGGVDVVSDEFCNPNIWLKNVFENGSELISKITKMRAIPVSVKYTIEILLANEIDVFKCTTALLDTLWLYNFVNFEFNGMYIDAVILLPDTNQITIDRNKTMTSDNTISVSFDIDVKTYYPSYRKDNLLDPNNNGTQGSKIPTKWNNYLK